LVEEADRAGPLKLHGARVHGCTTGKDAEEGRLAGPIGPDDGQALASSQGKREANDEGPAPGRHGNSGNAQHTHLEGALPEGGAVASRAERDGGRERLEQTTVADVDIRAGNRARWSAAQWTRLAGDAASVADAGAEQEPDFRGRLVNAPFANTGHDWRGAPRGHSNKGEERAWDSKT